MADSFCGYRNPFDNYFNAITLDHSPELKFSGYYMVYLTGISMSAMWRCGWAFTSCHYQSLVSHVQFTFLMECPFTA